MGDNHFKYQPPFTNNYRGYHLPFNYNAVVSHPVQSCGEKYVKKTSPKLGKLRVFRVNYTLCLKSNSLNVHTPYSCVPKGFEPAKP